MANTFLLGGTGMVGTQILNILRGTPAVSTINIIARRDPAPADSDTKLTSFIDADTTKWPSHLQSLKPAPQIYFCAFATTKANAGGFENQYKIEHDLNLELAKEAKAAGTKVFVLISSTGADKASRFSYLRLKGDIEEDVKALDFEHTVILQPGTITGTRQESRPAEAVIRKIADAIAQAAVNAGLKSLAGEAPSKVWVIRLGDILRVAST